MLVIVVVIVTTKDAAEATPAEAAQCAVSVASLDDEVPGVLDGGHLLDTDGQRQASLQFLINNFLL